MKQVLNSSSTKTYPNQLVVPRASWETLVLPKYVWITTIMIAMALLAVATIFREHEGLRLAQSARNYSQQTRNENQVSNELMRREIKSVKQDKEAITREAQGKLNYLKPNEIMLVMK